MRDVFGKSRRRLAWPLLLAGVFAASMARAELPDEFQVYDDSINAAGQFGLELHLNTTPDGRSVPAYPGEIPPDHGIRNTFELSYGLSDTLEAGLYLPFVRDEAGTTYFARPRARLKWIPLKPEAGQAGMFAGLNVEVSAVNTRLEQGRPAIELRPIIGYRDSQWLFVVNPVIDLTIRPRYGSSEPDFNPGVKIARTVVPDWAVGLEYYDDFGPVNHFDSANRQSEQLFAAVDYTGKGLPFNVGIGRGLNAASDKWTIKAIFEIPI